MGPRVSTEPPPWEMDAQEYQSRFKQMQRNGAGAAVTTLAAGLAACAALLYLVPLLMLLSSLLAAEAIFLVYFQLRRIQLNRNLREQLPPGYNGDIAFARFLAAAPRLAAYMDPAGFFSRWFFGAPLERIRRGNVEELVAWGFHYRPREWFLVDPCRAAQLAAMVSSIESVWGLRFPPGHDPSLRMMAHLWEPLPCHHRPLVWYALTEGLALLKHAVLLGYGFRHHWRAGHCYYTYGLPLAAVSSAAAPSAKVPLLFLHGVGLGLLPYLPLLHRLAASGHPLLAVESKHLAMRLTRRLPAVDDVVAAVMDIASAHGLTSFSVVGHSFGTLMASRIVQLHPQAVHSLTLLDPVCFLMLSGHLVRNFVYLVPQQLSQLTTWLVARDMHTAASVTRHFFWSLLMLYPEDLPAHCLVVLSEHDTLVPVRMVRAMLHGECPSAAVLHHPSHAHADFVADLRWQDEITSAVLKMVARASGVRMRHDSASSYSALPQEELEEDCKKML